MKFGYRWLIVLAMLLSVVGLPTASAQGYIVPTITGYTVNCDNWQVSYQFIDPLGRTLQVVHRVWLWNASPPLILASATTAAPTGAYTVNVPIGPVLGTATQTYLEILLLDSNGSAVGGTETSNEPCYGSVSPPISPPNPPPQPPSSPPANPTWNGWTDGRLNPDPAEYYTIYCEYSSIKVYGKSNNLAGGAALIERIPLGLVADLDPNGDTLVWGASLLIPLIITRNGDTITIAGNFGYLAPLGGTKTFSLSQCQQKAGGTPPDPVYQIGGYNPTVSRCDPERGYYIRLVRRGGRTYRERVPCPGDGRHEAAP